MGELVLLFGVVGVMTGLRPDLRPLGASIS